MTKVEIFHNVAEENGRRINWFGYEPDQPVVKVFECPAAAEPENETAAMSIAEVVFAVCNGHGEGADVYYGRKLRSLSVGDVVKVGDYWLAVDSIGYQVLDEPPNDVTDTYEGEHGTHPWTD